MTTAIIISLCILLLFAYVFDLSSAKTKIPSVILLLALGYAVKQASVYFGITIPNLIPLLPILGTIGLILIVLEGSLELELNKSKLPMIGKSSVIALIPMILGSLGLAFAFQYYGNVSFKIGLANAIPLAIISSAIAIPSAKNLLSKNKEFITYESSLSDIFGVLFFNFITLNDAIGSKSVGFFILELVVMLIISLLATLSLAFFLDKIKHTIKFLPIILMIILIYAISKEYHLPALLFILLFGLFLGNIDELKNYKLVQKIHLVNFNREVFKFKELTTEIAFLIRALFFMLFGYLIETAELFNSDTIIWAIAITIGIFVLRFIFLKLFKFKTSPLLFIAPRGLITILLFFSIPASQTMALANKSLIIQVIILTAFVMMLGLMKQKKHETGE
jgi:cell volume regulation protein A